MRLLKFDSQGEPNLTGDLLDTIPPYAILSHTWGYDRDEVNFDDLKHGSYKNKAGYAKIQFCGEQAKKDEIEYFWVDTCCIDKANHSELSEAIVSMFDWYRNAVKCYVYLSDVTGSRINDRCTQRWWESDFRTSRWFRRGWTLQELLAPTSVEFFSREGELLGSKTTLKGLIHETTQIPSRALDGAPLSHFSVPERLRWAARRHTKRLEDKAYCLLGIFEIYMPLIYGEGDNAFRRLKEEINSRLKTPLETRENLPSPSCAVPFRRDDDFVNHGDLLRQIDEKCGQRASRVALVGIGGVGKSQLAIEYCHCLHERSPETWIFWVHASNAERIEQGFRKIAEIVDIAGRKDPQENIYELVSRWLEDEKTGKWLLVLDNADDAVVLSLPPATGSPVTSNRGTGRLKHPLSMYLPQSMNGALLVTTRTKDMATKLVEWRDVIAVEPMARIDAMALLKKKLNTAKIDSDMEELARILEFMPLAIVQAAAYIEQKGSRYSVRQYIEAFQRSDEQKTSLLNYEAGHLRRDPQAKNSIITTWQISFDYIREQWPLSADLLALMSFFDHQGIPEEVLTVQVKRERTQNIGEQNDSSHGDYSKDEGEDEDQADEATSEADDDAVFEENVDRLRSYSFISVGEDRNTLKMHGLVQLAMRRWLKMHGESERWNSQFIGKLNMVLPTGKHEHWSRCEMLFPHTKAAERQRPVKDESLLQWAQILRKAGWYAWAKGDYREAERMCDRSVRELSTILGGDDVEVSFSSGLLAVVYRYQGRWPEAEKIFKQLVETRRRVLGEQHPHTLTSLINLASTYRQQGRWAEAEEIGEQVMETRRTVLGDEHPSTLSSLANLASTYRCQKRWTEAEEILKQVIQTRTTLLGEEHPVTISSVSNLALTMKGQGRNIEAVKLMSECVQLRNRVLGAEHPRTLFSSALLTEWQGAE